MIAISRFSRDKKIKTEKKTKNKNFDKIKKLEIKLVKINYATIPDELQSELKS